MAPAPSDRIKEIFYDALERPEDVRAAFLDEICTPDERPRVEQLLTAHASATGFMGEPTADFAHDHTPDPDPELAIGEHIGPYCLLRVIGEGGFGTVYLAEQTEPILRQVAIKIVKPGMDTGQVIARFEAERQALALMEHPAIAKVIDAGATPYGRPYFVMEYVEGRSILDHCDTHRLTVDERLRIFIQICLAVQHAHQKGIIHRDLKPSNILVTNVDGQPTPKIIDFGIAKAVRTQGIDVTRITIERQLIGTPEYMSPEQAAGESDRIDTRSDVYSLGVLLYELLCGKPPFDRKRLRAANPAELERVLRDEEPPRPSTQITQKSEESAGIAAERRTEPARLQRELRGDLDWIVMRAIEKDPERRYPTANALGVDVERHRAHEPIEAGAPSALYVAGKFLRRHRVGVIAAGIAISAVAFGLVTAGAGFIHARQQTKYANQSAAAARAQLWEANLAQAKAIRQGTRPGRRFDALEAIANAAALRPSIELRNEAIASLELADVRLERIWTGRRGAGARGLKSIDRFSYMAEPGDDRIVSSSDARQISSVEGPDLPTNGAIFSSTGRYVAHRYVGERGLIVNVSNAETGERLFSKIDNEINPRMITFGATGDREWIVLGENGGTLEVYDLPGGELRLAFDYPAGWAGLIVNPTGDRIAVSSITEKSVRLHDAATGELLHVFEAPCGLWEVDFSADGRYLAAGGDDFNIYVWSLEDMSLHAVMSGHQGQVVSIDFASTGSTLASTAWDNTIRLWDVDRGELLVGPLENWGLLAFADWLVGVSVERVGVWWFEPAHEVTRSYSPDTFGTFADVKLDPKGEFVATGGSGGIVLWDSSTGQRLLSVTEEPSTELVVLPDANRLLALLEDGLYAWDLDRSTSPPVVGPPKLLWAQDGEKRMSLAPDGETLVVTGKHGVSLMRSDDAETFITLEYYRGLTTRPSTTPDLRYIFTGSWKGEPGRVRDVQTGETVVSLDAEHVIGTFSHDGRLLVIGSGREFICYDTSTWSILWTAARDNTDSLAGVAAFPADSSILGLTRSRFALDLVEPLTGEVLATLESPGDEAMGSICFDADASTMAVITTGHLVHLYDLRRIRSQLRAIDLDWGQHPNAMRP